MSGAGPFRPIFPKCNCIPLFYSTFKSDSLQGELRERLFADASDTSRDCYASKPRSITAERATTDAGDTIRDYNVKYGCSVKIEEVTYRISKDVGK